jgi:hypothetical protein
MRRRNRISQYYEEFKVFVRVALRDFQPTKVKSRDATELPFFYHVVYPGREGEEMNYSRESSLTYF